MKRETLFEPVISKSIVDVIIEQIENLILSGVLREGAQLPSERSMAESFEVSRPKLREALGKLEEHGLIRAKRGGGTFIAELSGTAMSPALLALYSRRPVAFFDYLEYRREQEVFAAGLAAMRATEEDKQRLTNILTRMNQAHKLNDTSASYNADIDFHECIVDASHNSTLNHMMRSIYELTRQGVFYNRDLLRSIDTTGEELLRQHAAICNAIVDGDAKAARSAVHTHLDFVEKSILSGLDREAYRQISRKRRLLER